MLFDLLRSEHEGWTRLAVVGELDLAAAPRVRQAILPLVPTAWSSVSIDPPRIILDLGSVDFIDSAGLGIVLGAVRRIRAGGGLVAVVIDTPQVREVFTVIGLDRVLPVFASCDEVVAGGGAPVAPAGGSHG